MEILNEVNPLYALSGCLHSEDDIPKCIECGCEIVQSNMSDSPWLCNDCFKLEQTMETKQCAECNYEWSEDCDFCPCCDSTHYNIIG